MWLLSGTAHLRASVSCEHPFHRVTVDGGMLEDEAATLLRRFFSGVRSGEYKYGSYDIGRGAPVDFIIA